MESRKPNCTCNNCSKPIYRRPFQLEQYNNVFCSKKCKGESEKVNNDNTICPVCNIEFQKSKATQIYCSKKCSGFATRNRKPTKRPYKNNSQCRLQTLQKIFTFSSCMIEGCDYSTTFDIHRFVEGKDGGKYEIGNMFAICPNHHAEIHRGITKVQKVDDQTLKIER